MSSLVPSEKLGVTLAATSGVGMQTCWCSSAQCSADRGRGGIDSLRVRVANHPGAVSLRIVEEMTGVWDRVAADEAAALELYPMLRRFAAVVAPPEVAPDDLIQDALVATLRVGALASFDDPGAYLRRTMLNHAANHRRRFARARRAMDRWRAGASERVEDSYPSDLADLAALSPMERAVLYLHEVEGVSFDDISAQLGVPAASARQVASRARRRLRVQLKEES